MSSQLITALIGGGIGIGVIAIGFLLYRVALSIRKAQVAENAKEAVNGEKLENALTILLANQNNLSIPDEARKSFEALKAIRTDHTEQLLLEAQKAKAKKKALKPREIKKTKRVRLV